MFMSEEYKNKLYSDSIFFVETEKIKPNPYQPRREFDENKLKELSRSIRQYGILQPLVVSRMERVTEDGGMEVEYELIAGERRLRASRLAEVPQVPVIIRTGDSAMAKLELAIIENLQREDLNAVDRARAFKQLADEFSFSHTEIGRKMGKSRVYVSNTLRLLKLPDYILDAVAQGKISEGHTRPLGMLEHKPQEQETLFKEILYKKITVRDAESIARSIAKDKARKKMAPVDPELSDMEKKFAEVLGTRVTIAKGNKGGSLTIDFFTQDDLREILSLIEQKNPEKKDMHAMMNRFIEAQENIIETKEEVKKESPSYTSLVDIVSSSDTENKSESESESESEAENEAEMEVDDEELPDTDDQINFEDKDAFEEKEDEDEVPVFVNPPEMSSQNNSFQSSPANNNIIQKKEDNTDDEEDIYDISQFTI
ncbi:MAG: ParB family chromosome partitioning protein [Flavobacteriaceae bacterium]|jgi:ParB family chromosome partitioning protein